MTHDEPKILTRLEVMTRLVEACEELLSTLTDCHSTPARSLSELSDAVKVLDVATTDAREECGRWKDEEADHVES